MLGRRELYHQQEGSLSGRCQVGFNALFALPIAARAVASLALWNIAACTALIVVVINALFVRFLGLFSGEILEDLASEPRGNCGSASSYQRPSRASRRPGALTGD